MKTLPHLAIAALVGAALTYAMTSRTARGPQPTEQRTASFEAQTAPVAHTVRSLDNLPTSNATAATRQPPPAAPAATSRGHGERADPMTPSHMTEDLRDLIHYTMQQQAVDPTWSRQAKSEIGERLYAAATEHSRIKSIDCRSTVCEVKIGHDSRTDYDAFLHKVFARAAFPWKGEIVVTRADRPDDPREDLMVAYFGRPDTSLPRLE